MPLLAKGYFALCSHADDVRHTECPIRRLRQKLHLQLVRRKTHSELRRRSSDSNPRRAQSRNSGECFRPSDFGLGWPETAFGHEHELAKTLHGVGCLACPLESSIEFPSPICSFATLTLYPKVTSPAPLPQFVSEEVHRAISKLSATLHLQTFQFVH